MQVRRIDDIRRSVTSAALIAAIVACHQPRTGVPASTAADERSSGRRGSDRSSSVSGEALAKSGVARFEDLLRLVPGVQVVSSGGGSFTVRVRGTSSVNGGGDPLFLIDGVIVQGNLVDALKDISPAEIARIDVLRDAGSLAYYGSRGANGVILITRKKAPANAPPQLYWIVTEMLRAGAQSAFMPKLACARLCARPDDLRGRVGEVAHDLPADRRVGVEKPVDDGVVRESRVRVTLPNRHSLAAPRTAS
jgi:TonB-dependent SusC/RagA subfamily outer membrane receptor